MKGGRGWIDRRGGSLRATRGWAVYLSIGITRHGYFVALLVLVLVLVFRGHHRVRGVLLVMMISLMFKKCTFLVDIF